MNNSRCRSVWICHRLGQLYICTTPFIQGPWGKGVGLSGVYLLKGWFTTEAWQVLIIVSAALSIPGQKKCALRNCFVFTIPWCVSSANFRICFCNDRGMTIRYLWELLLQKRTVLLSFCRNGFRSCNHFPLWIWESNFESVTSLLLLDLLSERVTAWRSDMFINCKQIAPNFCKRNFVWMVIVIANLLYWRSLWCAEYENCIDAISKLNAECVEVKLCLNVDQT